MKKQLRFSAIVVGAICAILFSVFCYSKSYAQTSDGDWGCWLTEGDKCSWDAQDWGNADYTPLAGDVNGDGKADRILYRSSDGDWGCWLTDGGKCSWDAQDWGNGDYTPLTGDVNGDGKADRILYRPSDGDWGCWLTDGDKCSWDAQDWGNAGYKPLVGDVNGDGKTDRILYRPSDGDWGCWLTDGDKCSWDAQDWGNERYIPLVGDVNGDGKADRLLYRPGDGGWGCWFTDGDKCSWDAQNWGNTNYTPLVGDVNGDGKADRILYRPADGDWGCWFTDGAKCSWDTQDWGHVGYTPLIGDTNGDGKADRIRYRTGFVSPSIPNLVLLYVNADNDLHVYIEDLFNRAHAGAMYTDGIVLMALDGPEENDSYLYRLDGGNIDDCTKVDPQKETGGENIFVDYTCNGKYIDGHNVWRFSENFGAPETLTQFIKDSIQTYPSAQKIILALVGHGGGWSPNKLPGQPDHIGGQPGYDLDEFGGLLWDFHAAPGTNSGHALSTTDLGSALQAVQEATGRKIDLLYLDACLMGMWEVAYEVKDSVNYLLASESWSWTSFQYERHLSAVKAGATTEQIGVAWARHEADFIKKKFRTAYTYSLIRLGMMNELSTKLDALADALTATLPSNKLALAEIFTATDRFDSTQDENYVIDGQDNYADLGHLSEIIVKKFPTNINLVDAAQAVSTTLASTIIANEVESGILPAPYPPNRWTWQKPTGLSIYLPLNPNADDWKRTHYHQLRSSEEHRWDDLITAFWGINTEAPDAPQCPSPCGLPPTPLYVEPDDSFAIYLPLVTR
ncbi:MAG: clostripain-related cysteine peptidase [Caldilineaceae bacterium]